VAAVTDAFGPLVSAAWLAEHRGDVAVADVRWYLDGRSGRDAWLAGRIPGAVFVDVDTDLSGPAGGTAGRHPLPTPEAFASALGRLGVPEGRPVVAYDDTGGMTAARLWWMLRALGEPAAVLDGGLAAWVAAAPAADEALASGPAPPPDPVHRTARAWPADRIVGADELDPLPAGLVLLDARPPARYRGEVEPIDARPGHVPGARNAPWDANLDPATGRFRPPDELRRRYEALGVRPGTPVVASCGSGVSACADLLGLELAGLASAARLFPASWSGWAADPARPAERG
jgi:thiosulfate/3-mercaptopyruvate sulfurtransferase